MKPMLAGVTDAADVPTLMDDDSWVVQQKLDGDRLLISVEDGKVSALNRNGEIRRNAVPKAVLRQFLSMPGSWLFDGELLDELWLFDLPHAGEFVRMAQPYEFRLSVLERFYAGWRPDGCVRLLPTARGRREKTALLDAVLVGNGEGVMFKNIAAPYRSGKRSAQMLKAKFDKTADVVVTAVSPNGRNNCTYGAFDNGRLIEVGSCGLAGKPPVHVGDVIEVRYLYASEDRRLYQPRMLRRRDDKSPTQCTIDQLIPTNRSVVELPRTAPHLRQRHRCRSTGSVVALFDTYHPDNVFDPASGRWVTICETHEFLANHPTLRQARWQAAHSEVFCPGCRPVSADVPVPEESAR